MTQIEIDAEMIQIDAEAVAKALKLAPEELRTRMRAGSVTSRFETGEGEDEGRVRLTFLSATRRARFTADMTGKVLSCTTVDLGPQAPARLAGTAQPRPPSDGAGDEG